MPEVIYCEYIKQQKSAKKNGVIRTMLRALLALLSKNWQWHNWP